MTRTGHFWPFDPARPTKARADSGHSSVRYALVHCKCPNEQETEGLLVKEDPKEKIYNVRFLCTGNSARSIMAEAVLNRASERNFRAFSAGSQPKDQIHPYTLDLLRKTHYDTSGMRPKSWL